MIYTSHYKGQPAITLETGHVRAQFYRRWAARSERSSRSTTISMCWCIVRAQPIASSPMTAFILEPATASFDRPDVARQRGECSWLPGNGVYTWHLSFSLQNYEAR